MLKFAIISIFLLGTIGQALAQQERKYIREGNDLFDKQDFEKAEVEYRKAADKKADSFEAAFNMADALYKQKKYDEKHLLFLRQSRDGFLQAVGIRAFDEDEAALRAFFQRA